MIKYKEKTPINLCISRLIGIFAASFRATIFGAEGETRTLAPVTRPTPLAGAPRHQLEYFCML